MSAGARSPSGPTGGDPFRHEREGGEEWLVSPVTAQRGDATYRYPSPSGSPVREFLPGEELTANLDDWEGRPLVLRHPTTPDGTPTTVANADDSTVAEVGEFRSVEEHSTTKHLRGEVWIRANEIGTHGGDLRAYVDRVRAGRPGEVSTSYTPTIDERAGRHDGERYEAVQRDLDPDHLALLPDNRGNCPVSGGVCGVGRLNHRQTVRANHRQRTDTRLPSTSDDTMSNNSSSQLSHIEYEKQRNPALYRRHARGSGPVERANDEGGSSSGDSSASSGSSATDTSGDADTPSLGIQDARETLREYTELPVEYVDDMMGHRRTISLAESIEAALAAVRSNGAVGAEKMAIEAVLTVADEIDDGRANDTGTGESTVPVGGYDRDTDYSRGDSWGGGRNDPELAGIDLLKRERERANKWLSGKADRRSLDVPAGGYRRAKDRSRGSHSRHNGCDCGGHR